MKRFLLSLIIALCALSTFALTTINIKPGLTCTQDDHSYYFDLSLPDCQIVTDTFTDLYGDTYFSRVKLYSGEDEFDI